MSKYTDLQANRSSLTSLLSVAEPEDLCILTDYITDSGAGRLSLDSDVNKKLSGCGKHKLFVQADRQLIGKEILLFGGNSIANIYRGFLNKTIVGNLVSGALPDVNDTITYAELVQDVAKKSGTQFSESESIEDIEQAILLRIFKQAFDKMSETERKSTLDDLGITSLGALRSIGLSTTAGASAKAVLTLASLNVATLVASAVSKQMLGRVAFTGAAFAGSRAAATLAGPIGIAVATLWTLADLSSPAYRVTLPCVVQLAYMRQKYLADLNSNKCPNCSTENLPKAKFCSECGDPLTSA